VRARIGHQNSYLALVPGMGMTPIEWQKPGHMSEPTLLPQVLTIPDKGGSTKDTGISK
jgi:hypothetical protein